MDNVLTLVKMYDEFKVHNDYNNKAIVRRQATSDTGNGLMSVDYDECSKKVSVGCFKCGNLFNNDMHNCGVFDLHVKNPKGKYNPMALLMPIGFRQTGKAKLNVNRGYANGQIVVHPLGANPGFLPLAEYLREKECRFPIDILEVGP